MTQNPVEHKRPPVKWIVPIPKNEKGSFGRPSLCAACRGNDIIAIVLNFFLFEASTEAERKKVDTSKVQSIQLHKTHDEILEGIQPCRLSKKTLIDYNHKLEEWGFIKADGYRHTYEVFFQNVTEAMTNPPAPEKRKPRGRHVKRVKTTILEVKSTISTSQEVKPTISEDCSFNEIVNLKSEIVKLQSQISNLQSEMLNLQSVQSSYDALKAELDGILDAYRLRDCNRHIETIYNVASLRADDASSSFSEEDFQLGITPETLREAIQDFGKVETTSAQLEKVLAAVTEQSTPTEEVPPTQQALVDLPIVREIVQETITRVEEKPVEEDTPQLPAAFLKASKADQEKAEQMVSYTEKNRKTERGTKTGAVFSATVRGKSGVSQRGRQLCAALKILKENFTVEEYQKTYDERNDAWWNENRGSLTVEDMIAKTTKGVIRIIEMLERIESRSTNGKSNNIVQMPTRKSLSESSQKMSYVYNAFEEAAQANIDNYSSTLDDPFDIALG